MEVSQKTIRRDLVTFRTVGFPIEETAGDHGRKAYHLESGWGKHELSFTFDEACLTLDKRRTLRIKDKEVVGYEMLVETLSANESLALQEHGLGGRRQMGAGVFVLTSERDAL